MPSFSNLFRSFSMVPLMAYETALGLKNLGLAFSFNFTVQSQTVLSSSLDTSAYYFIRLSSVQWTFCISPQFKHIAASQFLPNNEGPSPDTTNIGKVADWPSYTTRTWAWPSNFSSSPVCVLSPRLDRSSGTEFNFSFHTLSDTSDTEAPMSNSIHTVVRGVPRKNF